MPNKIGNSAFINTTMKANDIHAKKKFGQNFLKDEKILNEIVDVSECDKDTLVIEVGPGLGSLTEVLCKKAGFVLAYEIDNELIPILRENLKYYDNFDIINQDILEADINSDINKYKKNFKNVYLVANLPYYITTPILEHIINQNVKLAGLTIMVQKEVAERFMAQPKTKEYGYFTLFLQHYFKIEKVVNVGNKCFYPSPKVDSMVIKLTPRIIKMDNFKEYNNFIKRAFIHKRKTLRNNLGNELFNNIKNKLNEMGYNDSVRAEEITENDYVELVNYLYK